MISALADWLWGFLPQSVDTEFLFKDMSLLLLGVGVKVYVHLNLPFHATFKWDILATFGLYGDLSYIQKARTANQQAAYDKFT